MRNLVYKCSVAIVLNAFFMACSSNATIDESQPISEKGWKIDDVVRFELAVKDTLQPYDVYITLRHNTDYEWMNLFVFLKTYYPDQKYSRDTLECFLADETGRWFGKGSSSVKDVKMLFKKNVRFPQKGHYVFEFTQGMRVEEVKNIMDFGFIMVPSQTPQ